MFDWYKMLCPVVVSNENGHGTLLVTLIGFCCRCSQAIT